MFWQQVFESKKWILFILIKGQRIQVYFCSSKEDWQEIRGSGCLQDTWPKIVVIICPAQRTECLTEDAPFLPYIMLMKAVAFPSPGI